MGLHKSQWAHPSCYAWDLRNPHISQKRQCICQDSDTGVRLHSWVCVLAPHALVMASIFLMVGSYDIDSESNEYFSFISVFQGCSQETISPVLVSPDDNVYACSDIKTQPAGTQVKSTCGIPYSAMSSGRWRIILAGDQISSQRTITLTVGVPQTTRVTRGNTNSHRSPTRPNSCSYVDSNQNSDRRPNKLDVADPAAVAVVTVTYTQTTYTVTRTVVTTVPGRTTTELVLRTTTATITPAPSTVCTGGNPDVTITINRGNPTPVTRTDVVYLTSHLSGTVWVGKRYRLLEVWRMVWLSPDPGISAWRLGTLKDNPEFGHSTTEIDKEVTACLRLQH
ncbi:hypothetical protein CHGG_08702 [Chaetomium globosum CBS 148.51]|uniref:Uncharacterized protein n=1 Tax=Chaetomium globosum (strain ATCC 6205 / CBS 148.51 / DSM 1962 / NBRC 6347 / NRRL 1970) TaxID=306901 RepID=Q2GTK2_CHAGB|nr:uncharacterized protein CHGG_08702 [Chaetomium globosum CBS 148.51]EAQ84688.1 hypothetical protein CHGG_08702 [Chaetomium globosum CBS 148.51]